MFYARNDEGVSTLAPARRRVGHEIELTSKIGNDDPLSQILRERELTPPNENTYDDMHRAHCRCDASDNYPIHAQYDESSTGGEYIVGGKEGVLYLSDAYLEAVDMICRFANDNDRVKIDEDVGGHIHVSNAGMLTEGFNRMIDNYLAMEDQFLHLASCEFGQFRNNGHVGERLRKSNLGTNRKYMLSGSVIISDRGGKRTYEWRLWNASIRPQTLYTNAGLCVGMVEAAAAGLVAEDGDNLVEFLDSYLTGDCAEDAEQRLAESTAEIPPRRDIR